MGENKGLGAQTPDVSHSEGNRGDQRGQPAYENGFVACDSSMRVNSLSKR